MGKLFTGTGALSFSRDVSETEVFSCREGYGMFWIMGSSNSSIDHRAGRKVKAAVDISVSSALSTMHLLGPKIVLRSFHAP